jgi:hypothetical protein
LRTLRHIHQTSYPVFNSILQLRDPKTIRNATINEIKTRFAIIKKIAAKHSPHVLGDIREVERLTIANASGQISDQVFIQKLKAYHRKHNLNPFELNRAEAAISSRFNPLLPPPIRNDKIIRFKPIILPKVELPKINDRRKRMMPKVDKGQRFKDRRFRFQ